MWRWFKKAEETIKQAKNEIDLRRGCEELFHSMIEATDKLLLKHGRGKPSTHSERFHRLEQLEETSPPVKTYKFLSRLRVAYDKLHTKCYYEGETRNVKSWIEKVRSYISDIESSI